MDKCNIAVFISGNGTDLQALIDAQGNTLTHGKIAFVLSSSDAASGVKRAKLNGIPVLCLSEKKAGSDVFYATLEKHLRAREVDLIVLAGYLPLLSSDFTRRWNKRIVNIHPSLLPKYGGKGYYGLRVHQAVLDNSDEYTGATIHYVNERLDEGEIIAQEKIRVDVKTAEELQKKVLQQVEWKILPATVEKLCKEILASDETRLNVAVIGGGGREHALAQKISLSPLVRRIVCLPGNDGIVEAENVDISLSEQSEIISLLKQKHIDLCVIGPEKPLSEGLADRIRAEGIACFGPGEKAATIESSKVFAKKLMEKYRIPTAPFKVFNDYSAAVTYVKNCVIPIVVKADGLCGGKGAFVCENENDSVTALKMLMRDKTFGESGSRVVIEEKLNGVEISVMILTDGENYVLLPSAQDYKKAYDGDNGPNTGSMGAIAPHPSWTQKLKKECIDKIIEPTLVALRREGIAYSGCLYFGLMLTTDGLKVLEYNCRFGDPETEAVLPLINQDIVPLLLDCANGCLKSTAVEVSRKHCCAVVLAANGYPYRYAANVSIFNIIRGGIICAGVKLNGETFVTSSGRIVCALGCASTKDQAAQEAYDKISEINCEDVFCRKDIGKQ